MSQEHYKSEYWLKKMKDGESYASLRDQIIRHSPKFRDTCLAALDVANTENKEVKELNRWRILVLISITLPFTTPYLIKQLNTQKRISAESEIKHMVEVENTLLQCSTLDTKKTSNQ